MEHLPVLLEESEAMQQSELDEYQFSGTDHPWRDKSILTELYHGHELSTKEIAKVLDCSYRSVSRWFNRHDIERRTWSPPSVLDDNGGVDELERLYHDEGLTQEEIADRFGVTQASVGQWIRDNDLALAPDEAGKKSGLSRRRDGIRLSISENGYVVCRTTVDFYDTARVRVHRLQAVAEFGFDAVADMHVHHKNHIPFDNRPSNIEVLTPSDHMRYHMKITNGSIQPPWLEEADTE